MLRRIIVCLCFAVVVISLSACGQTGYYFQAAKGQWQLISKRQPVEELISNPATSPDLRQRLLLAESIRQFAADRLGLQQSRGFTYYTDLGRPHVVWNVIAAPRFSIEPKNWCFPIAGCVAYKGFFDQQMAEQEKQALLAENFDVMLYGVAAYSTLGWFADPLLNTFIHYPDSDLAALIMHELAHQIVYLKDDSAFNEAFATTVEQYLLQEWLQLRQATDEILRLQKSRSRHIAITDMVLEYRDRLAKVYSASASEESLQQQKDAILSEMRECYLDLAEQGKGTRYYDWWFSKQPDNARLLTVSTYHQLVPAFSAMLASHDGNLDAFFSSVKILAGKPRAERDELIKPWLG